MWITEFADRGVLCGSLSTMSFPACLRTWAARGRSRYGRIRRGAGNVSESDEGLRTRKSNIHIVPVTLYIQGCESESLGEDSSRLGFDIRDEILILVL